LFRHVSAPGVPGTARQSRATVQNWISGEIMPMFSGLPGLLEMFFRAIGGRMSALGH
jgi:hypothetical protein